MKALESAAVLGMVFSCASTTLGQMIITSAERSVSTEVTWSALNTLSDSETDSVGPYAPAGQWDAVAEAYADSTDWGQQAIAEQHSFIGPGSVTADTVIDVAGWPSRPSLGYMTLKSKSVLNFEFTVNQPTSISIDSVFTPFIQADVFYSYTLKHSGGSTVTSNSNTIDIGGSMLHYDGLLAPGDYTFTSTANYQLLNVYYNSIGHTVWNGQLAITAVPAPGAVATLALCAGLGLTRRHRR